MNALKEWSSVVSALESGEQTVVLRKGGILDVASGFRFDGGMFALFPTHEHQDASSIKPQYRRHLESGAEHGDSYNTVGSCATVIAESDVSAQSALDALSCMHIWSDAYIAQRAAWKPERPMRAALLRVFTAQDARVRTGPEHAGCKSWVDIDYNPASSSPVIDDAQAKDAEHRFREAVAA